MQPGKITSCDLISTATIKFVTITSSHGSYTADKKNPKQVDFNDS